jgi:hypothetical protein
MFGAVNALFTALAFAGLIYTVLLQRDQLALQQKQMIESDETQRALVREQIGSQRELFEGQKAFQDEQRKKQTEHDLKLEQLRQDFQEIVEKRRKDREAQSSHEFENNILRAIRRELEALSNIYDNGIGAKLAAIGEGQTFPFRLGLTQEWFTVFNANATHLGKIDGCLSQRIITVYALLKALIEEYRINNEYVIDLDRISLARVQAPADQLVVQMQNHKIQQMVQEAAKIKEVEALMKQAVAQLYALLDQRDIH